MGPANFSSSCTGLVVCFCFSGDVRLAISSFSGYVRLWQFDFFTKFSRKSSCYERLRKALLRQPGLGIYGAGVVIRSSRVQDLYPATRGICFSIAPSSNLGTRLLRLFEIFVSFVSVACL